MKAYLTDQDELVIEAESTVEVMALKYWSDDYFKRKPKRSSLLLQFTVARPTNAAPDAGRAEITSGRVTPPAQVS